MAIPIRTTITCPACGAFADVTMADTSVGPAQRRGVPRGPASFALLPTPGFTQTRRDGESWLSCDACGAADFTTVRALGEAGPKRSA